MREKGTDSATVPPPLSGRSTREARREGDSPHSPRSALGTPTPTLPHEGHTGGGSPPPARQLLRTTQSGIRIPILRAGTLAHHFCQRVACAHVEAVFERCLYLRHGDAFICIGEPAIGNGPLTLIGDIGLSRLDLQPGDVAAVSARQVIIGHVAFALDRSETWRPPPWPTCAPHARLIETCEFLSRRGAAERQGLARDVLGGRTAAFARWLSGTRDAGAPVQGLIGLGPGLTPSGDDFLVGALAALDAVGARDRHAALARAVTAAAGATSALSGCFLRAAADGHVGEALHRAVAALLAGDVDAAIAAIAHVGHSSGWDMLAGSATVLRSHQTFAPSYAR